MIFEIEYSICSYLKENIDGHGSEHGGGMGDGDGSGNHTKYSVDGCFFGDCTMAGSGYATGYGHGDFVLGINGD